MWAIITADVWSKHLSPTSVWVQLHLPKNKRQTKSDIILFCFRAILLKVSSTSNELHTTVNFNLQKANR